MHRDKTTALVLRIIFLSGFFVVNSGQSAIAVSTITEGSDRVVLVQADAPLVKDPCMKFIFQKRFPSSVQLLKMGILGIFLPGYFLIRTLESSYARILRLESTLRFH